MELALHRDKSAEGDTPLRYRRLLADYRRTQLEVTEANLRRLERVFDATVRSLQKRVAQAGPDTLASAQMAGLLADVEAKLEALRQDYATLLKAGMAESAQTAADREAATAELIGANADPRLVADMRLSDLLTDGSKISVQFGRVAAGAVERAASRVYSDGWQLSDRLYNLDAKMRETIRDTLVQGVTEQISARQLGRRLESALAEAGADNPRYQALRIARTEIVTAHREAHIQSCLDPVTGQLKSYILGVGWRLSLSHPHIDICDVWADDDGDGLGPGNYLPENVPSDHPHGLCYTITVLKDYPDVAAPSKDAQADDVTETQARYYAEKKDDPAARRWLDKRGL